MFINSDSTLAGGRTYLGLFNIHMFHIWDSQIRESGAHYLLRARGSSLVWLGLEFVN
jgi:hypothetical protein